MTPIRVRRDQFLNRDKEFSRHLSLAAGKCGEDGWILILLDADDDCPAPRSSPPWPQPRDNRIERLAAVASGFYREAPPIGPETNKGLGAISQAFVLSGAPGEIRTPDPLVRSQVLYPTELRAL